MKRKWILIIILITVQTIILSPCTILANSTNVTVPSIGTIGGSDTPEPPLVSESPSGYLPPEEVDVSSGGKYVSADNSVDNIVVDNDIISNNATVRTGDDFNNSFYMMLLLSSTIMLLFLFLGKWRSKEESS